MTPLRFDSPIATPPGMLPRPIKRTTVTATCPTTGRDVDVPLSRDGHWWACVACGGVHRVVVEDGKAELKCL